MEQTNPVEMRIRRADGSDYHAITTLTGQLGYTVTSPQIRERLDFILQEPDQDFYVADIQDVGVVGWVHIHRTYHLQAPFYAEIGGLVVEKTYRGSGVGKALITKAEQWVRDQGLKTMRIRTNAIRVEAHEFYKSLSYELDKTQLVLIKNFDPKDDTDRDP
jgi:GNAT superfamily N-acetyltransferase